MAGTRRAKISRLAAMAAADRINLLLENVDEDEILCEILSAANMAVQGSSPRQTSHRSRAISGSAPQGMIATARSDLGKEYCDAKKKSLENLQPARFRVN